MEAIGLGIDFGGLTAVDDFNLTVGRTEICGLIGPNGAGKTTVFNLLTKVYKPTRGKILLNGQDTAGMNTVQVNRAGIARTFQNIRLFKALSVLDNVLIGMHNALGYRLVASTLRLPAYWRQERARPRQALELLSLFGMEQQRRRAGGQPALRRPAAAGDRAGAGHPAPAAAAGRTRGRHEPLRDRRADGEHPPHPGRPSRSRSSSSSTT